MIRSRSFFLLIVIALAVFPPSFHRDDTRHYQLDFCNAVRAQTSSFKDVVVSHDSPPDEQEDPGFPKPGENPVPIEFFDAYSWRLFVAVNWPAKDGTRGIADQNKEIGDTGPPRVWETWKSVTEIFLDGGARPLNWDEAEQPLPCPNNESSGQPAKTLAFSKLGPVLEDLNQFNIGVAVGPLVAANRTYVRSEIRINRMQFDHILNKQFYLRSKLPQNNDPAAVFPDQSIELKAAWREFKLPEDQSLLNRYYHVEARAFDPETKTCQQKTFGLIGLHIAQKTKNRRQWTWSTFEHVDNLSGANPTLKSAPANGPANQAPPNAIGPQHPPERDPEPTLVRRVTPIPDSTRQTNIKWHSDPKIKGTVWENYDLVMTQWPIKTLDNDPTSDGRAFPSVKVANVTMETFLQKSACIGCHLQSNKPNFNQTDFAWFLSLRAFPPRNSSASTPGVGFAGRAADQKLKENAAKFRAAAEKAHALRDQQ